MTCSGDDVSDPQGSLHLKVISKNKKVTSHLSQHQRAAGVLCPGSSGKVLVPVVKTVVYDSSILIREC